MIVLTIFVILLTLLTGLLFFISYRLSRIVSQYEIFFSETTEDIEIIIKSIEKILEGKVLLTDDPDVQNLMNGIKIAYHTLSSYVNVNKNA